MKNITNQLVLVLGLALGFWAQAAEEHPKVKSWLRFEPCTLVATEYGDGDSFRVRLPDGDEQVFRLAWVDCPESVASYANQIAEQATHFGVSTNDIPAAGQEATKASAKFLAKPFTVRTRWADAQGRSRKSRYYAFIVTADGRDLGEELLRSGWARVKGIPMNHPDGTKIDPYRTRLEQLELDAKTNRRGLWAKSPPAKP